MDGCANLSKLYDNRFLLEIVLFPSGNLYREYTKDLLHIGHVYRDLENIH